MWLAPKLESAVHKESAKDVDDPVKRIDQLNANDDESAAHYDGADNAVEQNFVLQFCRDLEIAKNDEEEKQIVYAQGKLNHIASREFQGGVVAEAVVHQQGEAGRQSDPYAAPGERLT